MRLTCFLADLDGGGAERTMLNLCRGLAHRGVTLELAVGRTDGPARAWLDPDTALVDLAAPRARQTFLPLRRHLRHQRPDIVFATKLDANIVAAAAVASLGAPRPRLVVRETNSHIARGDIGPLRRRATRWAYHSADAVVALSEGVRRELIELYGLPEAAVVTIHNPVDVEALAARGAVARAAGSPCPRPGRLIVAIGRLTRQKGFDRLLRSFAATDLADTTLAILGEGEDRAMLEALARELGIADHVLMPGFVREPIAWLAHADMFVLSSRWEGFGHVIVEAMAAGTPVIAFDCPHGPRDIIRDRETGLLVPDGQEADLSRAIRELADRPELAHRLAVAARAQALRFSLQSIADTYLRLFESLTPERVDQASTPGRIAT